MSRSATGKPWLHAKSGYWCTSLNRRRMYLDKDYRAACRKLRQLASDEHRKNQAPETAWLDTPWANLADEFLDHIAARRKPATLAGYRFRLLRALQIVGPTVRVADITKLHLAKIEQRMYGKYSPSTVKDTLTAVQTLFNWAVKHDLLTHSPLVGYEKPAARPRTRTFTAAEFQKLLRNSDVSFRRVLLSLKLTGCRPVEVRTLTWGDVDLDRGLWILRDHKTVTQQRNPRPRIIPLPPAIWKLCRRLYSDVDATANVFLNASGTRYTKDSLCRKMARARARAGIAAIAGEQIVLYCTRHTFGTEASGRVSDIELAALMGHTDVRTTQRYVHINTDRLHDIQQRALRPTSKKLR